MSITFVQKLSSATLSGGTSSAQSVAFTTNPTIGNTIIVPISVFTASTISTLTVSDTAGNSYTVDAFLERLSDPSNFQHAAVARATVTSTGANFKVTVSTGVTSSDFYFNAVEFSGVGSVDKSATAGNGHSTTSLTVGPTATLGGTGRLLIGALGVESSTTNAGLSDPATFSGPTLSTASTSISVNQDGSTIDGGQFSYAIASSTTAPSVQWTYTNDTNTWPQYIGALVAYAPAAVAAIVPQIQSSPQIDTSRAAGFGLIIAAAVAAPHSSVLRPITIFPQNDPTQPTPQVYDPAFNSNVISTLALSQSGAPPQDDPGLYYGNVYKAVVAPPAASGILGRFIFASQTDPTQIAPQLTSARPTPPAVSGILGRFIFASQADPTQLAPQVTFARPTPPPSVIGAQIFVPFQSVDLTLQSVYMEPWHGPQGPVPPYRFASQANPTQIQPVDVMAAPILPVIHGPTVRPVQFTPAQFDITINGTKYWTPSTFSPGTQGVLHMPNLIGVNYYMALEMLQAAGIYLPLPVYAFSPSSITVQWARSPQQGGIVIAQSIATGTAVKPGQALTLTVSDFPFGGVIDSPPDWSQPS